MNLVHLTSSTFYGGPERQMLGLADHLPDPFHTTFVSFREGGRSAAFLAECRARGYDAVGLATDFPRIVGAVRELTALLRRVGCELLLCHGYKANILGRVAARRVGVPVVAVSRGWTGENRKVRLYDWLDRRLIHRMDHVVCVSEGQADKVRRTSRVPEARLTVIRNSARLTAFETPDPTARQRLLGFFGPGTAVTTVVLAAGRLSPEKGFSVLIRAAVSFLRDNPGVGVALFGEGVYRPELEAAVRAAGLTDRFVLPGFRRDLDGLTAAADVMVLPSFTEGLPNVVLEASAAGVPVVATAVGGTPEVLADGETGFLVPPGESAPLAAAIRRLLADPVLRRTMGAAGRDRMRDLFTFESQATAYRSLFDAVCPQPVLAAVRGTR